MCTPSACICGGADERCGFRQGSDRFESKYRSESGEGEGQNKILGFRLFLISPGVTEEPRSHGVCFFSPFPFVSLSFGLYPTLHPSPSSPPPSLPFALSVSLVVTSVRPQKRKRKGGM